jgi:hypothetical protein
VRLTAYETYCLYLAIKSHFTTQSYDYHKYQGKIKVKKEAFEIRKDRFQFQKLSRMYTPDQMVDFLVANFIRDVKWVGDLLNDEANANYLQFTKRKQSFTYTFTNEVQKLFENVESPQDIFKIKKSSSYPILIESVLCGDIGYDVLSVINEFFNFVPKFDRDLGKDDILWKPIRLITLKLTPFIQYDKFRIKSVLKQAINT